MSFNKQFIGTFLTCGLVLTACETTNPHDTLNMQVPFASFNVKKQMSPTNALIIKLLKEEKFNEASTLINQSLQSQPKNIALHLLNSMTYEKLAELGNASGTELAAIGYQNVLNLDPSNAFALTQLGKLKYREKAFDLAQENFANALLVKPNDPDLWQELAAASYYNYDIKTALSAINKAEKLKPNDPLIHRSASMIYAALGDFNTAKKHLDFFVSKAGNDPAVEQVTSRFNDWQSLYKSGRVVLAAATPSITSVIPSSSEASKSDKSSSSSSSSGGDGGGDSSGSDSTPGSPYDIGTESEAKQVLEESFGQSNETSASSKTPSAETKTSSPQIVIDCYLLRISEDSRSSKGQNILENLAVTLNPGSLSMFKASLWGSGAPSINAAAGGTTNISAVSDSGFNTGISNNPVNTNQAPISGATSSFTPGTDTFNMFNKGALSGRIFTAGLTWAGLTYSLNIANATDNRTEVVSRPSLMTFLHKPSVFFSGDELVIGFTGQYGGTLAKYPVGVTLDITPQALEGDLLTLEVGIEGSLLTSPNPNLTTTVDVAKTRVDTYVKLRLGETLMLGGIYERREISSKMGFPGLQDIPIAQYFFSNETTESNRTSIVFMLTPRSPDAVKAAVNRAMTREAVPPHLSELIARNPDWFNTHANLIPIFRYLATDPVVYYEFRSADILPPSWGWEPPIHDKLSQVVSFLYY